MSRAVFSYAPVQISPSAPYPEGRTALRPQAVATVTASNGESLRYLVLPDSGADTCVFPMSLAMLLKINILKCPQSVCHGVGGASVMYHHTVHIDLGQGVHFDAYAGFTGGLDAQGIGLLGQDGFFSTFDVTFQYATRQFFVELP